MVQKNILVLSEEMRVMWARAGSKFPGEMLNEVVTRALLYISVDRNPLEFYEVRRSDVPTVFNTFLKLQSTGLAHRYIETDEDKFYEVLKIEATLLDAIMLSIMLLLDVILGMLSPSGSDENKAPIIATPTVHSVQGAKPYTPTWKRHSQRIVYEMPSV